MKVLVACDSYKGSCSAVSAVQCMAEGIRRADPRVLVDTIPMADGGEGLVDAVLGAVPGRKCTVEVKNPLGAAVQASFGILEDGTAVIEMAAASGLPLLSRRERNPLKTTTYGTGQLIRAALDQGCTGILMGIGGSATNDAGAGMAQALGVRLLDRDGMDLPFGGGALDRLSRIDFSGMDERLAHTRIIVASDVVNPLCGEKGASAVYGPQKGATPEMVQVLENNLAHFAEVARKQTGRDVASEKGAGAAGGLGAGLKLFCNAELRSGVETVLDITGFDDRVKGADAVITGEGRIDYQSVYGKVPVGVAKRAKRQGNIPVIALVGSMGERAEEVYACGIDSIFSIAPGPVTMHYAINHTERLMRDAAERVMRLLIAARA